MNLTKLLKPKSVAVIGASEKEGFGGDVCRNTLSYVEDMSRVYFVHPKRESVFGVPCYKSSLCYLCGNAEESLMSYYKNFRYTGYH